MSNMMRQYVGDTLRGLVNKMTGTGTHRDKTTAADWVHYDLTRDECQAMFANSWIARKGVSIPAFDMLRGGWEWQLDDNKRDKMQLAESALNLRPKIRDAVTQGRLLGGAGVLIGDGHPKPQEPLDYSRPVEYLTVLSRDQLFYDELDLDVMSPWYGEPQMYQLTSTSNVATVDVHPSRIARFLGAPKPESQLVTFDPWGYSVLQGMIDSINAHATGIKSSHRLLDEATVNYHSIKGLLDALATESGTDRVKAVVELSEQLASHVNARILDADTHKLEQFKADLTGIPEVLQAILQAAAAGFDIPITRFLGQSPGGLNSTGEGDLDNYYDMVAAEQELTLDPPLMKVLRAVGAGVLNTKNVEDFDKRFKPLKQLNAQQVAARDMRRMTTLAGYVKDQLVPPDVARRIAEHELRNSDSYPGADAAYTEGDLSYPEPVDVTAGAEANTGTKAEGQPGEAVKSAQRKTDETGSAADSRPMTLYVKREVTNVEEVRAWAKEQGFTSIIPDLHVTVLFSTVAGDWHKAGEAYEETVSVPKGGPRSVEQFGNATVVQFSSWSLQWRNHGLVREGFTHGHPEYAPHMTITYADAPENVVPYRGRIELGPEVFEEIDVTKMGGDPSKEEIKL